MKYLSTALLLLGACKDNQPFIGPPPPCVTSQIPLDAEDEAALAIMEQALEGTWSVPWDAAPASFGDTLQTSGGVVTDALVIETVDDGSGTCPFESQVRRLFVSNVSVQADWLGTARTASGFYLESARAPDAPPTLIGELEIDQASLDFDAALAVVTEGFPVDSVRWDFYYSTAMTVSYSTAMTVSYSTNDSDVDRRVASCEGPCDIAPL